MEPSVVAFDRDTNKIKAIGEDARLMLGRTPGNIVAVRPLRQGVISDYTVTEKMMKYFIQKALGRRTFRKPRIAVCVPSGVTWLYPNQYQYLYTAYYLCPFLLNLKQTKRSHTNFIITEIHFFS